LNTFENELNTVCIWFIFELNVWNGILWLGLSPVYIINSKSSILDLIQFNVSSNNFNGVSHPTSPYSLAAW